jgi:hypothetical protein
MIINRNGESIEIPDEEFYTEHPECRPGQGQAQPQPVTVEELQAVVDDLIQVLVDKGVVF